MQVAECYAPVEQPIAEQVEQLVRCQLVRARWRLRQERRPVVVEHQHALRVESPSPARTLEAFGIAREPKGTRAGNLVEKLPRLARERGALGPERRCEVDIDPDRGAFGWSEVVGAVVQTVVCRAGDAGTSRS